MHKTATHDRQFTFDGTPLNVYIHCIDGSSLDLIRQDLEVRLFIHGLRHPALMDDLGYIGEATKDPRLQAATQIVSGIFSDWAAALPDNVQSSPTPHHRKRPYPLRILGRIFRPQAQPPQAPPPSFKFSPLADMGADSKYASAVMSGVSSILHEGMIASFDVQTQALIGKLEKAVPSIQAALDRNRDQVLSQDPNQAVIAAMTEALERLHREGKAIMPQREGQVIGAAINYGEALSETQQAIQDSQHRTRGGGGGGDINPPKPDDLS